MDRRDLLKTGAVLSLGGSGCATLVAHPGAVASDSLGGFLAALDAARESIASTPLFESFRDPQRPDVNAVVDERAALTRKVFRSLTLAGSLADLPPEQRTRPEVLQRVRDSMGEMDDAMFGVTKLLEDLSPSDRAEVGKALREDPHLGMRIMGEVDREAASLGLSSSLRMRLRTASSQAASRLRLSPDLAITEYTSKFRKLEARHGSQAESQRLLATSLTQAMLWQGEEEGTVAGGSVAPHVEPPSPKQCVENTDCGPKQLCTDYREVREGEWSLGVCRDGKPPRKVSPGFLTTGAIALGVGALIGIPSIAAVGGSLSFAFLITLGAVLAASGLIVLLIGLGFLAGGR